MPEFEREFFIFKKKKAKVIQVQANKTKQS